MSRDDVISFRFAAGDIFLTSVRRSARRPVTALRRSAEFFFLERGVADPPTRSIQEIFEENECTLLGLIFPYKRIFSQMSPHDFQTECLWKTGPREIRRRRRHLPKSRKLARVPTAAVALRTLLETIKRHGEFTRRSLSRTLHLPPTHSSPLLSPTGTSTPRERVREVFRTPRRPRRALRRSDVEIQHPPPAAKRDAGSRTRRARRRDGAV